MSDGEKAARIHVIAFWLPKRKATKQRRGRREGGRREGGRRGGREREEREDLRSHTTCTRIDTEIVHSGCTMRILFQ